MYISDGTLLKDAIENDRVEFYRTRPIEWIEDYLGIPYWQIVWSEAGRANPEVVENDFGGIDPYETHVWQGDKDPLYQAFMSVASGHKKTALWGSKGISKTYVFGSGGALWYLDTHRPSQFIVFAPTVRQMKDEGWRKNVSDMLFREGKEGSFMKLHPRARWVGNHLMVEPERYETSWAASMRPATVSAGESLAGVTKGLHGDHICALIEEYNEVKKPIRNGIESTLGGDDNLIVYLCNPGHVGDALDDLVARPDVRALRGTVLDFPNVVLRKNLIRGAHGLHYIHVDAAIPAAQRLGIDMDRMKDWDAPEFPSFTELAEDPTFASSVMGLSSSVRQDTYIPAALLKEAQHHLVKSDEAAFHHEFNTTLSFPFEGSISILEPPVWETVDKKKVYKRRYVVYMDLASSGDVTPDKTGDKSKKDYHTAIVYDAQLGEVVATARTRGTWALHTLCALWLCDRYTQRYPKTPEEAARPEKDWTGLAKPHLGWESNIGDIENLVFPRGKDALASELLGPDALIEAGLPKGRNGWPWASTKAFGKTYLYRDLSGGNQETLARVYGVRVTGANRTALVSKVGRWAQRIPKAPYIVRSPVLYNELGTWIEHVEEKNGVIKTRVAHADGAHDDMIFGLAGCLQMAEDLARGGKGPTEREWPQPAAPEPMRSLRKRETRKGPHRRLKWTSSLARR